MPIRSTTDERVTDSFIESPTRANKTAQEVYLVNPQDISGGSGGVNPNLEVRNAGETISALKCVYSFDANTVKVASSSNTLPEARAFGVAITSANTNESMQLQTYGTIRDTSFTFAANDQLYVSSNGSITNVAPVTGYRTAIGISQGFGSIFINIQEPIIL
jgi:hypothetical protein